MATILNRGDGRRAIQFENIDGQRRTLGLGKCPQRDAETVRNRIESILASKLSQRALPPEVAEWIGSLPGKLSDKLADFGLIEARQVAESAGMTLVVFVDQYIAKRTDTKPTTLIVYKRCRNLLAAFYKAKRLDEITVADAKDFARWMTTKEKPLSQNTARRMTGFARQFFNDAVDAELLVKNPFKAKDIKVAVRGDASGFRFLSVTDTAKLIDACPDSQWRLIVALSRFGGLRTPSETLALRWADIDWKANTIKVTSPKTAHHEGHGQRTIPLFGELRPHLEEAFNPEDEFVVTRYRDASNNLRTQFNRIVVRAGLTPWPQPFHAMRKSRQTELSDEFPEHAVCGWLGNSQSVARAFYLKTTDEHFAKAVSLPSAAPALRQPAETVRTASHVERAGNKKAPDLQGLAASCDGMRFG